MRIRILTIIFSFFAFLFFGSVTGLSQEYHTTSYKAMKSYRQGITSYDYIDYPEAERSFKQAIADDGKFYEAYMMLGELLLKERRFAEAAGFYQKAVRIDSSYYMPVFFSLATSEMMSGDYAKALVHYTVYLAQDKISDKNKKDAVKNLRNCQFAVEAIKHPVPFSPVDVGEGINTSDDEYWPSITADGQTLMFTRQSRPSENGRPGQEDFYISTLSGNKWQKAINAGSPLNTPQNEGAQSLSSDGSYMYFTACDRPGGLGSCDIYFSAYSDGKWSMPVNLGSPVNTAYWESTPSISSDGKTLYFSSNRPGGFGGKDLWRSTLKEDNRWTTP